MFCILASIMLAVTGVPKEENHPMFSNGMLKQAEAQETIKNGTDQDKIIDTITEFFGTIVGTSPYPGVRSTYANNDLMVQVSQINQDLSLLIGHDKASEYLEEHNITIDSPRILLSGKIEGTGFISNDASGHPRSDIGLTGAELDILAAYKAITAFMVIEFLNFPSPVINNRITNTNLFLDVAFVTIGDLNYSPFYLTIGQTFVPFGQYNSYNGFNNPLTQILFRTLAEDATIGYYDETFLGQFFFFRGDSHADSGNNINNYGFNIGANYNIGEIKNLIQFGYIRNVADALGMQLAFANSRNTNTLQHVVPGLNINGGTHIGHWHFVYEYGFAIRRFNRADASISNNGGKNFKGARPQAYDIEGSYQFTINDRASALSFGYSRSFDALGFNMPKWRTVLTWTYYIFEGTLLSLEYMHNELYPRKSVAGGQVAFAPGGAIPYFRLPNHKGRSDDTLTLDISFYW